MELKTVWEKYNENDLKELDVFTEDYRAFLSKAKPFFVPGSTKIKTCLLA